MLRITNMTSDPAQKRTLILPDGSNVILSMRFVPLQQNWIVTELTRNDFTISGLRIVNSPNMLNQFRNIIPFGFACFSTANREPQLQEDFFSSASILYLLTQAECVQFAEYLAGA